MVDKMLAPNCNGTHRQECSMNFSKISPWFNRIIILAVAALFLMISAKFILDPQGAATASGLSINLPLGFTNTRAGFGGFPLSFALFLIYCLFSTRRHLPALGSIALVSAVILAVRLYGAQKDGTFALSAPLLVPEAAILFLAVLGVLIEKRRLGMEPGGMRASISA
jgi:hypothetical protein